MNLDFLFFALMIGITGVIYRMILAYEPILNWWFMFGKFFNLSINLPIIKAKNIAKQTKETSQKTP